MSLVYWVGLEKKRLYVNFPDLIYEQVLITWLEHCLAECLSKDILVKNITFNSSGTGNGILMNTFCEVFVKYYSFLDVKDIIFNNFDLSFICPFIDSCKSLKCLTIIHYMRFKSKFVFPNIKNSLNSLKELIYDVQDSLLDGESSLSLINFLKKCEKLQSLELNMNSVQFISQNKDLTNLFRETITSIPSLTTFLYQGRIPKMFLGPLCQFKTLKLVFLSNIENNDLSLIDLIDHLSESLKLKDLSISCCLDFFSMSYIEECYKRLKQNGSITKLLFKHLCHPGVSKMFTFNTDIMTERNKKCHVFVESCCKTLLCIYYVKKKRPFNVLGKDMVILIAKHLKNTETNFMLWSECLDR